MQGQQNVKSPINVNGNNCSKSDACQFKTQWPEDDDGTTNGMKKFFLGASLVLSNLEE